MIDGVVRTVPQAEGVDAAPRGAAAARWTGALLRRGRRTSCSAPARQRRRHRGPGRRRSCGRRPRGSRSTTTQTAPVLDVVPSTQGVRAARIAGGGRRVDDDRRSRRAGSAARSRRRDHAQVAARDRADGPRRPHRRRDARPGAPQVGARASAPRSSTASPRSSSARTTGATPSFKGLYGFPKTLCTSINEEIVHGIPSHEAGAARGRHRLSVDVGACIGGLHADAATTVPVGEIVAGGAAAAAT